MIEISPIQKQFWLLQKIYRNNTAYNIPVVLKLNGIPDTDALEYAFNMVVWRHDALKVYFEEKNDEVFQIPVNPDKINLKVEKIVIDESFNEDRFPAEINEEIHKIFNLDEWPLIRIKLYIFQERISVLTIVFHHIIVDLHSKQVFTRDFSEFYNSFCGIKNTHHNEISCSYTEYLKESAEFLRSDMADKMLAEWKKYIPQPPDIIEIPADFPRPKINDLEGKRKHFRLDKELYIRISDYAAENNVKSFTVLLAAWAILLNRLTGHSEIIIGVPFTNRRNEAFKDTFGCFVNIVPVLVTFNENITGSDLLKQVRYSLLRIHRIQEIPFISLNDLLKNNTGNSILQAGFTFEPPVTVSLDNLQSSPLVVEKNGSQLDLFLILWEQDNLLNGYLEFSTLLFRESTAQQFIDIYKQIIVSYLENPSIPVSELDIISDEESDKIISWNNTDHEYTGNICLHQKFEQQVRKTPGATALLFGNNSLSYSEFDLHINRMANHLIEQGIKTEDIICICMERSPELMIGIYSILKAGAAYLPVDPGYPAERLEMILSDAKPKLILTNNRSEKNIPSGFHKIYLDNIIDAPLSNNVKAPHTDVNSKNLAYLIYTSGSTGKPKGVMIEHHSVINKLEWIQFRYPLDHEDTIMLKTPVTFDVSVWELFWWMFNGAKSAILPRGGEKDPGMIIEEVHPKKVTTIVFVPSMFSPFVGYINARSIQEKLKSLKWIIQIGEALSPQLVNSFNELLTPEFNPQIINTYGPTEATVAVSWYECSKEKNIGKIYIGKPIFNTKLLVMNGRNKIQPAGVPGELVITGVNLSRGYLNRPELNAEKFITFKYPDGRYLKGYKTGDVVKLCHDGNIDFIGRNDSQVKIRGFRIELGEIESKILEFPLVEAAAVIVRELKHGNKLIVGYVVLKEPRTTSPKEIEQFLSTRLPDYMIPGHLMILDDLPLNTSGKLDRKALPDPDFISHARLVSPVSSYEKKLQEIWKETLGLEDLGITQNFFDLGGNSILAVHMVNIIKKKFDTNVEPLHIMEHPNIRSLAGFISERENEIISEECEYTTIRNMRKQNFNTLQQKRRSILKKTS